ncbi:LOW QUALITY PROTEIN: damage-control phosphatase ARMT1 [Drosophila obscura]|uniref:LOW QUALITY PROTEIN: damage-control phosphatase ARMT1 n=1 Tax=Drosophila obscura TaxID=7282 RepID=UPI001BB28C78|nr:LOW QUALITY PROTEIN: damage-control phosphatase ARMT1 [Drosophila obscura]
MLSDKMDLSTEMTSQTDVDSAVEISRSAKIQKAEDLVFNEKHDIYDVAPKLRDELSGHFQRSFAYFTIKHRSPMMLGDMITFLHDYEPNIMEIFGDYAHFDLKRISWSLQLLRDEIQDNREFKLFHGKAPDSDDWNRFICNLDEDKNRWFSSVWLHAECYMYRRIWAIFQRSDSLSSYDYFAQKKIDATTSVVKLMTDVITGMRGMQRSQEKFQRILKLALWSNRCDLSINKEAPDNQLLMLMTDYESDLLVDQSADIWRILTEAWDPVYVDIVCDNAGFELFTDLLLAEYLIEAGLASKVRFHVKAIPWFISDVTKQDFLWMLTFLRRHVIAEIASFGRRLRRFMRDRSIILCDTCYFWTSPYDCSQLKKRLPCLYVSLSEAALVIFKGDLNYRKLLGDINWDYTAPLIECLRGFLPTSVCALRTIKSDIYCGLPICTVEWLTEDDPHWMRTGKKGVIQVAIMHRPSGDALV